MSIQFRPTFWICSLCVLLAANIAEASLVAHWTGDNTAADSTANNHDGMLQGDTTFAPGKLGQAFSFDGNDDYVTINASPQLEPSVISVAAWVKMGPTGGQQTIIDSSHGFVDQNGWALQTNPNSTVTFLYGNGSTFSFAATSSNPIDDDVFHHIVGVLDGSEISIYIDGALDESNPYSMASPSPSQRTIRIGSSWNGNPSASTREVNGLIDDVRIYDHALSLIEIRALAIPEPESFLALFAAGTVRVLRRRRAN